MATLANDDVVSNEGRDIFIVNAGLEDEAFDDGGYSYDAPGWVRTGTAGDHNPLASHIAGEADEGSNVGWLTTGSVVNTLSETYASDQNYVLSVAVAVELGRSNPQSGYIIRL
ncbi:hypothetical protein, partial [Lentilitoribacter sp. Alg239-R112]|uniref:hypothetical protein n=1 Tax=Lentilitoribacter sp. Alg239-R112 TaxID=2305987 RepID=UPI0013A7058F